MFAAQLCTLKLVTNVLNSWPHTNVVGLLPGVGVLYVQADASNACENHVGTDDEAQTEKARRCDGHRPLENVEQAAALQQGQTFGPFVHPLLRALQVLVQGMRVVLRMGFCDKGNHPEEHRVDIHNVVDGIIHHREDVQDSEDAIQNNCQAADLAHQMHPMRRLLDRISEALRSVQHGLHATFLLRQWRKARHRASTWVAVPCRRVYFGADPEPVEPRGWL
eukprot:CAMPEP_0183518644 /NCGR_PEP_ID=MMETSP0371-20130417/15605_1 /TAXON_ID=268820 /ORGANISM="Peridinium aciculiferum, Strain PAER-2" /LENGTH=220 /DNA_ID=CAMNT_0025716699 /DNA_START=34 /DNA_END=693 /DNA_ORIENTATION=+